jgi:hypothetical protein
MRKTLGIVALCVALTVIATALYSQTSEGSDERDKEYREAQQSPLLAGIAFTRFVTYDEAFVYAPLMAYVASDYSRGLGRAAGDMLTNFSVRSASARGAAQVSQIADETALRLQLIQIMQNQRLIDQNKQVIQLLTEIKRGGK